MNLIKNWTPVLKIKKKTKNLFWLPKGGDCGMKYHQLGTRDFFERIILSGIT